MRAIIILAAVAFTHGAKLERTYLPPSNTRTAGGSGNFLQTPLSGPLEISGFSSSGRNYQNTTAYSQTGIDFSQSGNSVSRPGNDFSQSGNGYAQTGAEYDNVNFNNFVQDSRPERPRAALERNAAILRQDNSNDGETFSYAFETENGIYAEESGVATNGVEAQGGYSYTGDDGQIYSVRYTADQNGFVPQGDHLPTPPPIPEEILKALEQNARDEAAGIYDDGLYNEGKYASADNRQFNYQQNNANNGNNQDTIVTNSALARSGNAPSYNSALSADSGIASTFGAPKADQSFAPTYGVPDAPSFNRKSPIYNAPIFDAPASNAPAFNGPVGNAPTFNTDLARNSATEKAYLPPFADQKGQVRNVFGRRQQTFNSKTGYNY